MPDKKALQRQQTGGLGDTMRATMSLFTPVDHSEISLKEAVRHLDPVHEAALYIQDALVYSTHTHPRPGEAARTFHLIQLLMQPLVHWALRLLVLITFFEMPVHSEIKVLSLCFYYRQSNDSVSHSTQQAEASLVT